MLTVFCSEAIANIVIIAVRQPARPVARICAFTREVDDVDSAVVQDFGFPQAKLQIFAFAEAVWVNISFSVPCARLSPD